MKKTKLILLGLLMTASLTACGSNVSNTSTAETQASENTTQEQTVENTTQKTAAETVTEGADNTENTGVLAIKEQGVFSAGGIVNTTEGTFDPINGQYDPIGQTSHTDHANVFYQIPSGDNSHPMVFLHGYGQSRMGWMTTPDGREGWSDMFLKMGHSVYLVDQPRRGEAGQTSVPAAIDTTTQDQAWYTQFRIGMWPDVFEGSQFPNDEDSLDQFFRQMTPNTGEFDSQVVADAMTAVFKKTGDGIFVTHSQGGIPGWTTAIQSDHVKAVVAIEPGGFPFPASEVPEGTPGALSDEDFDKLIDQPIIVYFGDNIPEEPNSGTPALDFWSSVKTSAYQFADIINERGGDCTIVYLPDEGITGNEHFMFQDLNNDVIAEHIQNWLEEKNLG